MYTYDSRVRYSELGQDGKLSLFSLLNYFQDCSTFHSEDIGLGIDYLMSKGLVWVMSAWQIVVDRYPALGEELVIGTMPYEFRSVIGYRNFVLKTKAGEQLACANAIYTLLDVEKGRPAKPTPEMLTGYVLEERLPMDYAPRKISIPEESHEGTPKGGIVLPPIEVIRHHLDTNNHVNNGQYINLALDFLHEKLLSGSSIRQLRAEYRKAAVLGDIMYPRMVTFAENNESDDKANEIESTDFTIISLQDEQGNPYCVTEFRWKA
ncbi:MAG: acyl-[acyl-carrier-protein] thioesterase [Lachnospiraceae bacterium]|jgi:acyl-ACP thioesterase|nr:acyl-[acyl-carrier-protein] thioesterase [Lachnospiraceae bacterium]